MPDVKVGSLALEGLKIEAWAPAETRTGTGGGRRKPMKRGGGGGEDEEKEEEEMESRTLTPMLRCRCNRTRCSAILRATASASCWSAMASRSIGEGDGTDERRERERERCALQMKNPCSALLCPVGFASETRKRRARACADKTRYDGPRAVIRPIQAHLLYSDTRVDFFISSKQKGDKRRIRIGEYRRDTNTISIPHPKHHHGYTPAPNRTQTLLLFLLYYQHH